MDTHGYGARTIIISSQKQPQESKKYITVLKRLDALLELLVQFNIKNLAMHGEL